MASISHNILGFRLRHVGVAVASLASTAESMSTLFGYRVVSGPFYDVIQKVAVIFLTKSEEDIVEIELIAPLSDDSPISSMLAKGGGAYHLCFETCDLEAALVHATNVGCIIISRPAPAVAFNGRRIAWIFTCSEQLFELLESKTGDIGDVSAGG
ncbi:MAG: VOC family protein [Acidobacteriota bacterium]|nr:VOC family protein [Acidobacteriota bacterium]